LAKTVGELGSEVFEALVGAGFIEFLELGKAGGHGKGVTAEGAGLVNGAVGSELVHDVGAATEGSDGEPTADDFAHGCEVGVEVFEFLNAALCEAEAGHDFIKDDEGSVFGGDVSEGLEVSGAGKHEASVGGVRLYDDGGDVFTVLGEGFFEAFEVVVGKGDGFVGEGFGDAGGVGLAKGEGAGASGNEEGVSVAVVAAFELYDFVSAGEATCEADG